MTTPYRITLLWRLHRRTGATVSAMQSPAHSNAVLSRRAGNINQIKTISLRIKTVTR
jgi:hypothetical protein